MEVMNTNEVELLNNRLNVQFQVVVSSERLAVMNARIILSYLEFRAHRIRNEIKAFLTQFYGTTMQWVHFNSFQWRLSFTCKFLG